MNDFEDLQAEIAQHFAERLMKFVGDKNSAEKHEEIKAEILSILEKYSD